MLVTQFKCQAFKMYLAPEVMHLHSHNTELLHLWTGNTKTGNWRHSTSQCHSGPKCTCYKTLQCLCSAYYPGFSEASISRAELMKCTPTDEQSQLCSVAKVGLNPKCPLETLKKRNPHEFWKKTWIHSEWLALSAWGQQGLQITTLSHYLRYHNSCIALTVD